MTVPLSTINEADMEDTGIDFLTVITNENMDEKKLTELVEKFEKENSVLEPPVAIPDI